MVRVRVGGGSIASEVLHRASGLVVTVVEGSEIGHCSAISKGVLVE
jgi:hypothetical protein